MLNATNLLAESFGRHLAETYERTYGAREPEYGRLLDSAGKLVTARSSRRRLQCTVMPVI